jgi:NADPH-dependent ferric siderophore reductase
LADILAGGRHALTRMRHDVKRRTVTVKRVTWIAPHMVRITFTGSELAGFTSPGFDDHLKLFIGENGRHYTPRRYDAATGEFDIEFALHDLAGPVTAWASRARAGETIGFGGPRGSTLIPDDFDWYLLAGDETALPAIARRLEELRPGVRAIVVAEVANADEEIELTSAASVEAHWVHRGAAHPGTGTQLEDAIAALTLPTGDGYAWAACEAAAARRVRSVLIDKHGHRKEWLKVASYWQRGMADVHETLGD